MSNAPDTVIYAKDFDPAKIRWQNVKHLEVIDVWHENGVPAYFAAYAIYHTGHLRRLVTRAGIGDARRICACLSAVYDVPMRDWTRPAPPTLELGNFFPLRIDVDKPALWSHGWQYTDAFFRDGGAQGDWQEAFLRVVMPEAEAAMRNGMGEDEVRKAVHDAWRTACDRRLLLVAANPRREGGEG